MCQIQQLFWYANERTQPLAHDVASCIAFHPMVYSVVCAEVTLLDFADRKLLYTISKELFMNENDAE